MTFGAVPQDVELAAKLARQRREVGAVFGAGLVHAAVHREFPVKINAVEALLFDEQPDAAAGECGTRGGGQGKVGKLRRGILAADG